MNRSSKKKSRYAQILLFGMLGGLLLLAAVVGHYANEVRIARRQTPNLVQEAWQRFGRELKLSDLTPHRKGILLAVEDPAFYRHRGVDLDTPGAGMTTITQGLAKMLYFPGGFKPGISKIRQAIIAQHVINELVSKDEQLALLLNLAYLGSIEGRPVHGFVNAAKTYFGKAFADLSDAEFQSLVAMLIAPNQFVPRTPAHTERMRRIDALLSGMYRPKSVLDIEYDGKVRGSLGEEAFMALLRLVTNAKPASGESQ